VQAHHGTAEVPARVVRVGDRFAQLRLERPVVAARGDHVILRAGHTVGGGRVLDPAPPRRTDAQRTGLLAAGDPGAIARAAAAEPLRRGDLAARGLLFGPELDGGLAALDRAGDWFFTAEWLETRRAAVSERLAARAASTPLDPGVPTGELFAGAPWAAAVLERLGVEQREGKAYSRGAVPALGERAGEAEALAAELAAAGPAGLRVEDRELAAFLEREGELIRLGDGSAVSAAAYAAARAAAVAEFEEHGAIRLAWFRDALGISRRPAQLLLERMDADGITRRVGDERTLRRSARAE
jgi:selenocysteine-specific elongation factor